MSNFKRECYTTTIADTFKKTTQESIDLAKEIYKPREVSIKSEGNKFDQGKPDLSILPFEQLEDVARILTFGAEKYGRNNYKQGIQVTRLLAAALRHLGKFSDGVNDDEESGMNHVSHAICNLLFVLYMMKHRPEKDDRS